MQLETIKFLRKILLNWNSSGLSHVDLVYRSLLRNNFFSKGWGDPARVSYLIEFQKLVSNREKCNLLVDKSHPITVKCVKKGRRCTVFQGEFKSPVVDHLPGFWPPESEVARFEFCVPNSWKTADRPVCVHMSGTGDQNYWRRRMLQAKPLLRRGIGSLLMENPFYGSRKPKDQDRSNLNHVDNIFLMGAGLVLESIALLRWLEREGYGPFCLTGVSMGGHMASIAATSWPKPIAIAPCLSWSSASGVFTRGVMSKVVNWDKLVEQFENDPRYKEDIAARLCNFPWVLTQEYSKANLEETGAHIGWGDSFKKDQEERQNIVRQKYLYRTLNKLGLVNILNPLLNLKDKHRILVPGKSSSFFHPYLFTFLEKLQSLVQVTDHNPNPTLSSNSATFTTKGEGNTEIDLVTYLEGFEPSFEAVEFMRRLMDHFTHLSNFEKPVDPELAIVVAARSDAYVLRDGVRCMPDIWPGTTVRYIDAGHIYAYVGHQTDFVHAIVDSIDKHRRKYNQDGSPKLSL